MIIQDIDVPFRSQLHHIRVDCDERIEQRRVRQSVARLDDDWPRVNAFKAEHDTLQRLAHDFRLGYGVFALHWDELERLRVGGHVPDERGAGVQSGMQDRKRDLEARRALRELHLPV